MINPINLSAKQAYQKTAEIKTVTSDLQKSNATKGGEITSPEVALEIGNQENVATYSKPAPRKPDLEAISELKRQADVALAPLRQMVEELLKGQGMTFKTAMEGEMVDITPEMRAEAQKQIGDGGAFSAENLSTSIVDFAKAISGGDKTKFDLLKENIQKGFDEAKKVFGGKLPEISEKTLELAMSKLEEWAKSDAS